MKFLLALVAMAISSAVIDAEAPSSLRGGNRGLSALPPFMSSFWQSLGAFQDKDTSQRHIFHESVGDVSLKAQVTGTRRLAEEEPNSGSDQGVVPASAPTTIVGKDGHGTAPPVTSPSAGKQESESTPSEGEGQAQESQKAGAVTFQKPVDMSTAEKTQKSSDNHAASSDESTHAETSAEVEKEEEREIAKIEGAVAEGDVPVEKRDQNQAVPTIPAENSPQAPPEAQEDKEQDEKKHHAELESRTGGVEMMSQPTQPPSDSKHEQQQTSASATAASSGATDESSTATTAGEGGGSSTVEPPSKGEGSKQEQPVTKDLPKEVEEEGKNESAVALQAEENEEKKVIDSELKQEKEEEKEEEKEIAAEHSLEITNEAKDKDEAKDAEAIKHEELEKKTGGISLLIVPTAEPTTRGTDEDKVKPAALSAAPTPWPTQKEVETEAPHPPEIVDATPAPTPWPTQKEVETEAPHPPEVSSSDEETKTAAPTEMPTAALTARPTARPSLAPTPRATIREIKTRAPQPPEAKEGGLPRGDTGDSSGSGSGSGSGTDTDATTTEDDDDRSSFGLDNKLFTHVVMDNLGVDEDSANSILALSGLTVAVLLFYGVVKLFCNCGLCGGGGRDGDDNGQNGGRRSGEISLTSTSYSPVATDLDVDLDDDDWDDPYDDDFGVTSTSRLTSYVASSSSSRGGSGNENGTENGSGTGSVGTPGVLPLAEEEPFANRSAAGDGTKHIPHAAPQHAPHGSTSPGSAADFATNRTFDDEDDFFAGIESASALSPAFAKNKAASGGSRKPGGGGGLSLSLPSPQKGSGVKVIKGMSLPGAPAAKR